MVTLSFIIYQLFSLAGLYTIPCPHVRVLDFHFNCIGFYFFSLYKFNTRCLVYFRD